MNFKIDKEFQKKMDKYIDIEYNKYFGDNNIKQITRLDSIDEQTDTIKILDRKLGVDTAIRFNNGQFITIQEKIRRYEYIEYQDFTLEYYSNILEKIKGEYFYLGAHLYFYGYSNQNQNGIYCYRLINILNLKLYLNKLNKKPIENKKHSNANFIAIKFDELLKQDNIIIYSS